MSFIPLLALALAPGIGIAFYIYFRDRYEPEPVWLLVASFAYGILALGLTILITIPLSKVIVIHENSLTEQAIHAFALVALVEEGCKFLFVRGILYRNKNFDEPFDGIVYAVMVGMGFATVENVLYVIQGGGTTAIIRMFTAVPAHALFAVLMGYFLGRGKFMHKRGGYFGFMALFTATAFHGVYDYFLFISFVPGIWILAFVSLGIAFILSREAIKIHVEASPFKPGKDDDASSG